ncbi:MAG: Hpt domain-containing protein [Myxococcales bacterium]|nr:Hpt domain-containing protein [Myxococcales bacterium]
MTSKAPAALPERLRKTATDLSGSFDPGLSAAARELTDAAVVAEELMAQTRALGGMLAAIRQGLFVIDADGRVGPHHSAWLERVLHVPRIEGSTIEEILLGPADLGPDERASAMAALEISFGQPTFLFEANAHLLPREIRWRDPTDGLRLLEVDWSPLPDEYDDVVGILVCVRDVTELRALRERNDAQQKRLTMLGEVLAVESDLLDAVLREVHGRVQQARRLVSEHGDGLLQEVFRELHTVKGVARNHHLTQLRDAAHQAEATLGTLPWSDDPEEAEARLMQVTDVVLDAIAAYEQVQATLLNRSRAPTSDRETLEAVLAEVRSGMVGSASERGKPEPTLIVEGDTAVRLATVHAAVSAALTHVLTNSVAHGLELASERAAAGKPEHGRINLLVRQDNTQLLLEVTDDGAGLDLSALRRALEGRGISTARMVDDDLAEHLFTAGVTTAAGVDQIAGRGIGMNAARDALRRLGGDLWVELEPRRDGDPRPRLRTCLLVPLPQDEQGGGPDLASLLAAV